MKTIFGKMVELRTGELCFWITVSGFFGVAVGLCVGVFAPPPHPVVFK